MIKKVDRQPRSRVESVLLSEGSTYVHLYLGLLKKVTRTDTQQCLLVWITDALAGMPTLNSISLADGTTDHEERIPLFFQTSSIDSDLPYQPLLRYLNLSFTAVIWTLICRQIPRCARRIHPIESSTDLDHAFEVSSYNCTTGSLLTSF